MHCPDADQPDEVTRVERKRRDLLLRGRRAARRTEPRPHWGEPGIGDRRPAFQHRLGVGVVRRRPGDGIGRQQGGGGLRQVPGRGPRRGAGRERGVQHRLDRGWQLGDRRLKLLDFSRPGGTRGERGTLLAAEGQPGARPENPDHQRPHLLRECLGEYPVVPGREARHCLRPGVIPAVGKDQDRPLTVRGRVDDGRTRPR